MSNLDPQVQIRIIELAWQMLDKGIVHPERTNTEVDIRNWTENFDKVYKALSKTVEPE